MGMKTKTPENAHKVEIGLVNLKTGYIYFDDVRLVVKDLIGWKKKETKFVTFNWLEERPFPAEEMTRQAEMIEDIAREAGIKNIEGRINCYLYPNPESFMKILGRKRYKTTAFWARKELHSVDTFNDHEIIHLFLFDLGVPPLVLAKGLVFHFRAKYNNWDMNVRSKRFLMQRNLPALYKTVDAKEWHKLDHSIMVPAWSSFVSYLIDQYGIEKVKEFYTATDGMEHVEPFSDMFKDVFGIDFQEVDRTWRLFIMRYEYNAEADTLPDSYL
jgi:hypothetical protein